MPDWDYQPMLNSSDNPGYRAGWVSKYCTMEAVDDFVYYYPYVLIGVPLLMIAVEESFIR